MVEVEELTQVFRECGDVTGRMGGAQGDPQAGGALGHGRGADRLDVPAALEEGGAQGNGGLVGASDDAKDR